MTFRGFFYAVFMQNCQKYHFIQPAGTDVIRVLTHPLQVMKHYQRTGRPTAGPFRYLAGCGSVLTDLANCPLPVSESMIAQPHPGFCSGRTVCAPGISGDPHLQPHRPVKNSRHTKTMAAMASRLYLVVIFMLVYPLAALLLAICLATEAAAMRHNSSRNSSICSGVMP